MDDEKLGPVTSVNVHVDRTACVGIHGALDVPLKLTAERKAVLTRYSICHQILASK